MSTSDMDDLRDATEERIKAQHPVEAADVLSDHCIWSDMGSSLSCGEAEALAALLYSHGIDITECVTLVIEGHGVNDDEGDDHCHNEEDRRE